MRPCQFREGKRKGKRKRKGEQEHEGAREGEGTKEEEEDGWKASLEFGEMLILFT